MLRRRYSTHLGISMTEPAFLLTADESAIVMREHEGRWYAVRIIRGIYGTFELLDIRPTLRQMRPGYEWKWTEADSEHLNFPPFDPKYRPPGLFIHNPTLNDYGVSHLSTLC